jgi:hypothetical protein
MNADLKDRLFPEPDPLALALYRVLRLGTMLPPPSTGVVPSVRVPPPPASTAWRAIVATTVPTVRPGRSR